MSYEYDAYYPPTEYAQPHTDPYFVHPNLAAAQLGLTPEEVREVAEEQDRWFKEYQQELEEDRVRVSTEQQKQQQHQDEARWVPTPSVSDFDPTPQAYEVPDESPEDAVSPYEDGRSIPSSHLVCYTNPQPPYWTRVPHSNRSIAMGTT